MGEPGGAPRIDPAQLTLEARRLDLEFQKAKWDYRKFIWGSVFAAIAIATIPPSFQLATAFLEDVRKNKELAIKQREFRDAYVKDFLTTALTQDIEVRVRFADYFASVSPSEYQAGWVEYRRGVRETRDKLREQINSMEGQLQALQQNEATRDGAEVRQLERRLAWAYAELGNAPLNRTIVANPRTPPPKTMTTVTRFPETVPREKIDELILAQRRAGAVTSSVTKDPQTKEWLLQTQWNVVE